MKKWLLLIVSLIIIGIGSLIYQSARTDTNGYLELAEKFQKMGADDQELFNLRKALESSIKENGNVSLETVEIYRKLGNKEKNLTQAAEDFDKAILIYEMEDVQKIPDTYYEKGYKLLWGGSKTQEEALESFYEVIRLYEENQYEDSNSLCMSYNYIAYLQEDVTDKLTYLKKAEEYFSTLTEQQSWEISTTIELAIGQMLFIQSDYTAALSYYDSLLEKSETIEEEQAWYIYAEASHMSGACLTFLNRADEGESRIKKAIEIYSERDDGSLYYEQAVAHTFLAFAYANMEPPKQEEALEAGIDAFSYYKQRDVITNIDLRSMEEMKIYLQIAYEKMYPEKESWAFREWFDENCQVKSRNYQIYTN